MSPFNICRSGFPEWALGFLHICLFSHAATSIEKTVTSDNRVSTFEVSTGVDNTCGLSKGWRMQNKHIMFLLIYMMECPLFPGSVGISWYLHQQKVTDCFISLVLQRSYFRVNITVVLHLWYFRLSSWDKRHQHNHYLLCRLFCMLLQKTTC